MSIGLKKVPILKAEPFWSTLLTFMGVLDLSKGLICKNKFYDYRL